ncbi:thioesterase II family protein [Shouchella lonarensis]|uniref:Surfactin synthase thioesterase subunit n=1 Tax=Shouchella lonarensis TaxID=1464122 RepID=A0A1G6M9C8_9BACI|nr:thioesterase domain-containing protein [Shouchella lonarensis]SDC52060.1 Surfactin synthase thioesterase subunit [Shouchella lonarensis]
MILFCLPYAGGSGSIYFKWRSHLHHSIRLIPIELKGRGRRSDENLYKNVQEAVNDIFENNREEIENNPYAIYGHSMGSILAYELYYKVSNLNLRKPTHIFFSGYSAPNVTRVGEKLHTLSDSDFIDKVIGLGGTPQELMDNQELMQLVTPMIRSDFKMIENYVYEKKANKIECNISILNGKQDTIALEKLLVWKDHTCKGFKMYHLEGDHFFLNHNMERIVSIINETIVEEST